MSRKLVEATRPLTITITQEDIDTAVRCSLNCCILAKGFDGCIAADNYEHAEVGRRKTKLVFQDKLVLYQSPPGIQAKLLAWDLGGPWADGPGTITFMPPVHHHRTPEQIAKQRERDKKRGEQSGTKFKNLLPPRRITNDENDEADE